MSVEFDKKRHNRIGLGTDISILEARWNFFSRIQRVWAPTHWRHRVGVISGAELGDLTPNGYCKEDGCNSSVLTPCHRTGKQRSYLSNPLIRGQLIRENFGGGGVFVLDLKATPMSIMGEYDSKTFNSAGCGGVQVDQHKQCFLMRVFPLAHLVSTSPRSQFVVFL